MNIFQRLFGGKQLPEKFLVWCIGIPYTQEQFRLCFEKPSCDFIDALQLMYGTNDREILWTYFSSTARKTELAVKELRKRNVRIIHIESTDDLKDAFSYDNIIITTHHHRASRALDFYGTIVPEEELVRSIPKDYKGTVDLSSCNSADFQLKCKLRAPLCTFIAVGATSSLELRLSLYRLVVRYLLKHNNATYLEALRLTAKEIIRRQNTSENNRVLLGGQMKQPATDDSAQTPDYVCSSVFAPSEVRRSSHLLVQVFLHSDSETGHVANLATGADKAAERRDTSVLHLHLAPGDKIDVELYVYGESCLQHSRKSIVWQGALCKCSFCYFVPSDIPVNDLFCEINLHANGLLVGNMSFITQIVAHPQFQNTEVTSCTYKKIFISYAHQDEEKVKYLAQAYKAQGIDFFYDRYALKGGDIYDEEIERFIDSSDLFILCWSDNSAKSAYVWKELSRALIHAYPQQEHSQATLKIYPICIKPYADLPENMKAIYNFEMI